MADSCDGLRIHGMKANNMYAGRRIRVMGGYGGWVTNSCDGWRIRVGGCQIRVG